MKLLVSTPRFLTAFDTQTRRAEILASGHNDFYGISWDLSGQLLALTRTAVDGESLTDLADYAHSERGYIAINGESSWPFLSAPHQILWIDDDWIVATNTGRNAIAKMRIADKSVIQHRYDDVLWDRLTAGGNEGAHYNSLFFKDNILHIVAHNFDKGSFILRVDWPNMREIDRVSLPMSGVHNLWIDSDDRWIICDTENSSLNDARTGEILWSSGHQGYLRGLAATGNLVLIGCGEVGSREIRARGETGIWLVESGTWRTLDYFYLGHLGAVQEVRITDLPDKCHHGATLGANALDHLGAARQSITTKRIERVSQQIEYARKWVFHVGTLEAVAEPVIRPPRNTFLLAMLRHATPETMGITAQLHLGSFWDVGDHASLIGRFGGPGDTNMVAALFQRNASGSLIASLWREHGGWQSLAENTIANSVCFPTAKDDQHSGPPKQISIGLHISDRSLHVTVNALSVLSVPDPGGSGAWGIRMFGSSLGIGDVKLNTGRPE